MPLTDSLNSKQFHHVHSKPHLPGPGGSLRTERGKLGRQCRQAICAHLPLAHEPPDVLVQNAELAEPLFEDHSSGV